jgi:hypothetical protein
MRVVLTSRPIMSQAVSVLSLLQYTNNSNLPHKGGLRGLFVKVLGNEVSPHFPADKRAVSVLAQLTTVITVSKYLIRVVSVVSS